MKLLASVNLTFITPCFCSGADPRKPEIRPASIRGEFRRWLRIFGADLKTESRIMGSAAGDTGTKSALVFRVRDVVPARPFTAWKNWKIATIDRPGKAYLTFFLTRQNPIKECLAPGTRFTLEVLQCKDLSQEDEELFWNAWNAMVDYGSLGARVSRGFGSWVSDENAEAEELPEPLDGFEALEEPLDLRIPFSKATLAADQERIFNSIGNSVKSMRKEKRWSGNKRTPFGTIQGGRQKSVYIFRPVVCESGFFLCLFHFPDFYAEKRDFAPKANGKDFQGKNFRKR